MLNGDEREHDHANWYEPRKNSLSFVDDVQVWKGNLPQPAPIITPLDSISNVSTKSKRSGYSFKSGTSSVSSARAKAEAEEAALLERAAGLKKKHALELQKMQLQSATEQNALECEGSSATFCTERQRRLNAKGRHHRILLRTMAQEKNPLTALSSEA
ncbi:hypothetical protein SRHO_G00233170 [Serrasalmus rhombeus]